jgi:sugar/nucleoside kinase (ribokinase family)
MKNHGIDVKCVHVTYEAPTSFTDVITEAKEGVRTFFHARGANSCFGINDIDFSTTNAE